MPSEPDIPARHLPSSPESVRQTAGFLVCPCSIARLEGHCCGFEVTGNQPRGRSTELQKNLRPAAPNYISGDHSESGSNPGLCAEGHVVKQSYLHSLKTSAGKDGWGSGSKVSRKVSFKGLKNSKNAL